MNTEQQLATIIKQNDAILAGLSVLGIKPSAPKGDGISMERRLEIIALAKGGVGAVKALAKVEERKEKEG